MAVIRPLIIGFATTLKHLFKKPVTVNYPEQKMPMFPKYRGKQVLMRDAFFQPRFVAHQDLLAPIFRKHRHFLLGVVHRDRRLEDIAERGLEADENAARAVEKRPQHLAHCTMRVCKSRSFSRPSSSC